MKLLPHLRSLTFPCLAILLLICVGAAPARADYIRSFNSDIHIQKDTAMDVEETIVIDFEEGARPGTSFRTSGERSQEPSGGLGAPWQAEPWPRPLESFPQHDPLSPLGRERPWEEDDHPEIDPRKRDRMDRPFEELFDNPFDDGDPLDDTGEEAWSLPSRPSQ